MRSAWAPLVGAAGLPPAVVDGLWARYAEPHRAYHATSHIAALARDFAAVRDGPGWDCPAEVAAALLFHDAIYEVGRPDNEARSAALAVAQLAGTGLDLARIDTWIRATADHLGASVPDADTGHLLDCDLAVLGAEPQGYTAYEAAVRAEYAPVVSAEAYRAGRAAFLRGLLGAERLFHTPFFAARLEDRARANLRAALEGLEGADPVDRGPARR